MIEAAVLFQKSLYCKFLSMKNKKYVCLVTVVVSYWCIMAGFLSGFFLGYTLILIAADDA